jgi:hypothetical protein
MTEDEITQWLLKRGRKKNLSIELAKKLATESRLGWLIFPHGHTGYAIGKATLKKLSSRHVLTDDDGRVITFASVDEAKTFLREELKILAPYVLNY